MNIKDFFDDDILNNEVKVETEENDKNNINFTDKTKIFDQFTFNSTKHEAIVPNDSLNGIEYSPLPRTPKVTAKDYEFELDTFQSLAISAIENDRSVLVSAHTSCGKTVVAEYAIAQSLKKKQRVIYTSPIKALSNQKFRELQEEFVDVGLMTGDVTLNPEATCLVMTTEIFRNMLYRGSSICREIHWVIFDEIHYLKDSDRGVVWEETIILMPKHARMIFLSATIPNAREFGEWIAHVCEQIVHIIYTEKRVIPLVHYFYSMDKKLREIKCTSSGDSRINTEEFEASQNKIIPKKEVESCLVSLLDNINVPAVIFSFARASCEFFASKLTRDFLSKEEKELVRVIFNNAISSLSEDDKNLAAIQGILPLFERGIGIHHSGLLPIIKEISEILFQESLIKVLFATETFSIGLNMPAKTVVFTSIKKFDGKSERPLNSGEYTQMSGRAGRRGLDKVGIVISLVTDSLASKSIIEMLCKGSDELNSAFRLTYNMVLNLMRVEDLDPMYMLSRSFYNFQAFKKCQKISNELVKPLYRNIEEEKEKEKEKEEKEKEEKEDNEVISDEDNEEEFNGGKKNSKENKVKKNIKKMKNSKEKKFMKESKNIKEFKITEIKQEFNSQNSVDSLNTVHNSVDSLNTVHNSVDSLSNSVPELDKIVFDKFVYYEDLLKKRNCELSSTYLSQIKQSHRIIDIMIPRFGFPLIIHNCIVNEFYEGEKGSFISVFLECGQDVEIRVFPIEFVCQVYDFRGQVNSKIFSTNFNYKAFPYKNDQLDSSISEFEDQNDLKSFDYFKRNKICNLCKHKVRSCLLKNTSKLHLGNEDSALDDEYFIQEYTKCIIDEEKYEEKYEENYDEESKVTKVTKGNKNKNTRGNYIKEGNNSNKVLNYIKEGNKNFDKNKININYRKDVNKIDINYNKTNYKSPFDIAREVSIFYSKSLIYENTLNKLQNLKEIFHMEKCKRMIDVLRGLGHLEGNSCTLKGKMASEISSADELLLTEMIFSSTFHQLCLIDMISLLSVVVTEKPKHSSSNTKLSDENTKLIESIYSPCIKSIVKVLNDCGFDEASTENYYKLKNLNFYMMDIVRMWISGYSFSEICNNSKEFEGSIIRGFKRLEEILRQLISAATVIGNQDLVNLFSQGIFLIKRDIVFANSLYL